MGIYQKEKGSQGICGTHISQRNGQSELNRDGTSLDENEKFQGTTKKW